MVLDTASRPAPDEHAPYYGGYIALVPDGNILDILEAASVSTRALLAGVPAEQEGYRYAPGKWSVREVVGHLADTERIMAYRALRIARGDATPLPGFDENAYVAAAGFDTWPLEHLAAELAAVRAATLALLRDLPADAWARRGTANGQAVSVRALAYIIAGHEIHHLRIVADRYLGAGRGTGPA